MRIKKNQNIKNDKSDKRSNKAEQIYEGRMMNMITSKNQMMIKIMLNPLYTT